MTTETTTGYAVLPAELDTDGSALAEGDDFNPAELSVADLTARDWDGDGRFRDGGIEDAAHDNTRRAGFALHAVDAYADLTGGLASEPIETRLSDLLGDLMHLADALGLDFDTLADRGRFHYEPETRGEL